MRRASALLVALFLIAGCASSQRPPVEQAKLVYADASIAYEAAMTTVEQLRGDHRITDAQMHQVLVASGVVRTTAPIVRDALKQWSATGTKPTTYDAVIANVVTAVEAITKILAEVQK